MKKQEFKKGLQAELKQAGFDCSILFVDENEKLQTVVKFDRFIDLKLKIYLNSRFSNQKLFFESNKFTFLGFKEKPVEVLQEIERLTVTAQNKFDILKEKMSNLETITKNKIESYKQENDFKNALVCVERLLTLKDVFKMITEIELQAIKDFQE